MSYACQLEVYVVEGKRDSCGDGPLGFFQSMEKEGRFETLDTTQAFPGVSSASTKVVDSSVLVEPNKVPVSVSLGYSPTKSYSWNDRFRVIDKKTVVLIPGNTCKFAISIPWSLVKNNH